MTLIGFCVPPFGNRQPNIPTGLMSAEAALARAASNHSIRSLSSVGARTRKSVGRELSNEKKVPWLFRVYRG